MRSILLLLWFCLLAAPSSLFGVECSRTFGAREDRITQEPIGDGTFLTNGGRDYLLVSESSSVDPHLHAWLSDVRSRYRGDDNAPRIAASICRSFASWGPWHEQSGRPISFLKRIQSLYFGTRYDRGNFAVFKAGDFARLCMGVCRHRATLMVAALRELGFQAHYVSGRLIDESETGERDSGDHAWVILVFNGRRYLYDPQNQIVPVGISLGPEPSVTITLSDHGLKRTITYNWSPTAQNERIVAGEELQELINRPPKKLRF